MARRDRDRLRQHADVKSRPLALSATLALVLLPSQLPAAALPLLRTEWNASSAELGWVVSAYLLGYAAAVLVVLPLTDRVRPSRVIVIGALVTALANLGFAFAARLHDRCVELVHDVGIGHPQRRKILQTRFDSAVGNRFRVKLLIDPLGDADGHHLVNVSRARAECQPVESM